MAEHALRCTETAPQRLGSALSLSLHFHLLLLDGPCNAQADGTPPT
jgi:hypothetical protein